MQIYFYAPIFLQTTDASLSSANDTIPKADALASSERKQLIEQDLMIKNQIPTAIVKPKYQRSSFDERQLPTVAFMNEDKAAWYDKQNNVNESIKCSAPIVTVPHPKKIHLPEFDGKAKKHMKTMSSVNSAHNIATAHNNQTDAIDNMKNTSDGIESVECADTNRCVVQKSKKSSASVAVVQPRKKERMDERKLMETIVQMQIKKNAQLYRGQGNKPNNNNNNGGGGSGSTVTMAKTKYFNNNHTVNNNNNGENCTNSERNHAKKDQKENSGMDKTKNSLQNYNHKIIIIIFLCVITLHFNRLL